MPDTTAPADDQSNGQNLPATPDMASYPVLAYDAEQLSDILSALKDNLGNQTLSDRDLQRVTVPSQGLEIWPVQGPEKIEYHESIDGIIIHTTTPRAYWSKNLDDSGRTPPDCSSPDGIKGNPLGDCLTCEFNQWGSDPDGDGKACREQRHLFMLRPGQFLPTVIQVPPTSIDSIKRYAVNLATNAKPAWTVVTSLKLIKIDRDPFPFSRIVPSALGDIPKEFRERLANFRDNIRPLFGATSFLLPPAATDPTKTPKDEATIEQEAKDLYPDEVPQQAYQGVDPSADHGAAQPEDQGQGPDDIPEPFDE